MDRQNIAYKLTNDVIKNYGLDKLEEKYQLSGADLFVAIYNKIFEGLSTPTEKSDFATPVFITGEDQLLP